MSWADPLGLDKSNAFLDGLQTTLGYLGMIPGVGEIFDVGNGLISLARGNYEDAAWNFGSALPGLGNGIGAVKWGKKAAKNLDSACFVAGTKVQTPSGEVNIEDVKAGDEVLSAEPEQGRATDPPLRKRVVRTFVRTSPVILDIHVGGEIISATPEHPFWVVGAGWTAAGELRRGSAVLTKDGVVVHVDSIERREGTFKVYNFEVSDFHTYYVSSLGVLVHNQCEKLIYRSGDASPSGLQYGRDASFRDSLSEPWPQGPRGPIFNKREYIEVDANKLPPGSVVYDGGTVPHLPPGHVTVNAPVDAIKAASTKKKFPR